jgi:peptidylprolyl isomerase
MKPSHPLFVVLLAIGCHRARAVSRTFPPPPDVATPPADARTFESGVATKIITPGRGVDHPSDDDCVKVRFTSWKRDGTLFSTSKMQDLPAVECLRQAMPGVAFAVKTMVAGEVLRIWVPARLAFVPRETERPPPQADLTFELELVDILSAPRAPIDLAAPPNDAVRTPSGLAFRVLRAGDGPEHPNEKSRVTIHFSGWKADGTLVDTTKMAGRPAVYSLGDVMMGWREGISRMVVGDTMRLWIPAPLAYGDAPLRRKLPRGALVYDIELLAMDDGR